MSGSQNHNEDKLLQELIAREEQKIRESGAGGLSPERIAAVNSRLGAEKEQILSEFAKVSPLSVKAKPRSRLWLPLSAAAAVTIAVGVVFLLGRPKDIALEVAYISGSANKAEATLSTGTKSVAMSRLGDFAVVVVGQNARLQLQQAKEKSGAADITVAHEQGFAFFSVAKSKSVFSVSTPHGAVNVTGTGFAVESSADGMSVQVLEGSVAVRSSEAAAKPVTITAGQKIRLLPKAQQYEATALSDAESKRLKLYSQLAALAGQSGFQAAADAIVAEIGNAENSAVNLKPGSASKLTLAEIRAKYGKVSRVNLKNGKSYTGFFQLKGAQMEIITPSGTVRVPTAELQDVQDM